MAKGIKGWLMDTDGQEELDWCGKNTRNEKRRVLWPCIYTDHRSKRLVARGIGKGTM